MLLSVNKGMGWTRTARPSRRRRRRAEQSCRCLHLRQKFLRSKGIADMRHVLTEDERGELAKAARQTYDKSQEQRLLQARDLDTGRAKGMGGDAKGKGEVGGAARPTGQAQGKPKRKQMLVPLLSLLAVPRGKPKGKEMLVPLLSLLAVPRGRPKGKEMLVALLGLLAKEASPTSSANRSASGGAGICNASAARSKFGRC